MIVNHTSNTSSWGYSHYNNDESSVAKTISIEGEETAIETTWRECR